MTSQKAVIIDAKGHLLGRLATYVAKQLQQGQKIVIVRCENTLMSGSHWRGKIKYMDFLKKRMSTNPKKGPIHFRCPSRIVWRVIRGMLPHTTPKGAAALGRLKCFDGVPLSLNAKKKMCVPDALRIVRLKPRSKYCNIGDIARECGWTKGDLIDSLETKRQAKNHEWHLNRVKRIKDRKNTLKNNTEIRKVNEELSQYGY
jgi:large subunit ribosomal protein L13Ae